MRGEPARMSSTLARDAVLPANNSCICVHNSSDNFQGLSALQWCLPSSLWYILCAAASLHPRRCPLEAVARLVVLADLSIQHGSHGGDARRPWMVQRCGALAPAAAQQSAQGSMDCTHPARVLGIVSNHSPLSCGVCALLRPRRGAHPLPPWPLTFDYVRGPRHVHLLARHQAGSVRGRVCGASVRPFHGCLPPRGDRQALAPPARSARLAVASRAGRSDGPGGVTLPNLPEPDAAARPGAQQRYHLRPRAHHTLARGTGG
mmetsp:Transcript_7668/g.15605  ORF Transcript_7668/g.15605 Transcript_7668/m.15605 type:complete len:261 (+) Transcript_7668:510-1292(+)